MDDSAISLIRIVVTLLYVLAAGSAYRWILPGLPPIAKGFVLLFFMAQAAVVGVALTHEPTSSFEFWLWHLDREWNIQATLASLQLASIGFAALLIALLLRGQSLWRRLYFAALALLFLFLAYDEYAVLHEFVFNWKYYYFVVGGLVVALTLAIASMSARSTWKWHGLLMVGLATSALGGLVVETNCGNPIFRAINLCVNHFLVEEPLEFLGMWLAFVALLNQLAFLSPGARWRRALFVLPVCWLLMLAVSPAIHPIERYADGVRAADVAFASGMRLQGYRLGKSKDSLVLFLSPNGRDFSGRSLLDRGYSIHLVDQVTGVSTLGRDKNVVLYFFQLGPRYVPVYRQWVELDRPESIPVNRAYWIVLSLWQDINGEFSHDPVLFSDHETLSDTQIILGELVVPAAVSSASPPTDPPAKFDNGFTLAAVEWPDRVGAGEMLSIDFSWRSDVEGSEDHAQFLHLRHAESGEWWIYDQMPLGPRLPTRLWYAGLSDSETWQVPLPADLAPGPYSISTGLYRSRDRERVPAQGADGSTFLDGRAHLGSLVVE
ncbi:MAG: hypothetical protein OXI30_11100 [Chloroflexota bacterium]|nr:hypothetical protein [Chloroflexota bacterium]